MPRKPTPGIDSLAADHPEVAAQWHSTWNGDKTPEDYLAGSGHKGWWRCDLGHVWQAKICMRSRGSGCPYCSGNKVLIGFNDLATTEPDVAGEWNEVWNPGLSPQDFTRGSQKVVWWRWSKDHNWRAAISTRSAGHGCPVCAGRKVLVGFNDLASQRSDVAATWHPTKNRPLTPKKVTLHSSKVAWWRCSEGHEWQATIYNRSNGSGCPGCSKYHLPPTP